MHHLGAYKTHGKKAKWEICKNATCCFEQILKVTPHKTAAVQPLTSYLINHPFSTGKVRTLISNIFLWTPKHEHASVDWSIKSYIHQLCVHTECCLEDLLGVIGMNGKRVRELFPVSMKWWWRLCVCVYI